MKKLATALTVLALFATSVGTASAASYAYSSIGDCGALDGNPETWSTASISDKLTTDGVQFGDIDTFGNCFKVTVTNADGTSSLQLYDPTTLSQIHL